MPGPSALPERRESYQNQREVDGGDAGEDRSKPSVPHVYAFAVLNRILRRVRIWKRVKPTRMLPMTQAAAVA